jgi:hypothetical protein
MDRDTLLDIELSAYCSRHRYTTNPEPVLTHLYARAGNRTDILAMVAGSWAGYYRDQHTRVLADALERVEGAGPWVELGRSRRSKAPHKNP